MQFSVLEVCAAAVAADGVGGGDVIIVVLVLYIVELVEPNVLGEF